MWPTLLLPFPPSLLCPFSKTLVVIVEEKENKEEEEEVEGSLQWIRIEEEDQFS